MIKLSRFFAILMCIVAMFTLGLEDVQASQVITSNQTGTHGGYDFEYWKDNGTGTMILKDGGAFSCEWSNINNILFRKGKKYNQTQTHQQLGYITMDYSCDYNPNGNSYLGVYGWTTSPLVEYYILESWGNWRPPGATSKGTVSIDGGTYDIYETTRTNKPSIEGTATFQQYWSVRQTKRTSGTISISEHFEAWEDMGMPMGNMYEVALVVEGYQSSGSADVTSMSINVGSSPSPGETEEPEQPEAPNERSAFTRIEAEEYNSLNSSTIELIGAANGGDGIGYIESGDSVTFKNIDFESGASEITALLASDVSSTDIDIRLDNEYGTRIGTLSVGSTGGWNEYTELSADIGNVTGVNDVVLCFSGPVNIDWFIFSSEESNPDPTPNPDPDPDPGGKLGDVDGDGLVNTTDYVRLRRHIFGTAILDGPAAASGDVDGNGQINSSDYALVKQYILGMITTFPGESEDPPEPPDPTEIDLPDFSSLQSNSRLPDPFTFLDGTRMSDKAQWGYRRAEISALAQKFEYGEKPPKPDSVSASFNGNEIRITCEEGGKSISFSCSIDYPGTGSAPYPAFIGVGMNTLNTSAIRNLGVACINLPVDELAEQQGGGSRGKGKFYDLYGSNHSAGALMAWAWGASRLIDALEITPEAEIDAAKLAVTGGSRYGKGALACGAFDERIALTVPQESGNGGASGWRTADAEKQYSNVQTLSQIIGENPWFSRALDQFSGSTNRLPHDHHMVLALCAPRGLLVIENPDFEWLGVQSCYDTASAASLIFEGLGIKDHFGYSSIGGHQHCQFPSSQQPELTEFIKKFLFDDNTADTDVFRTDHNINFDKSKWIDWSVPHLQ